jgi:hypothetical protein
MTANQELFDFINKLTNSYVPLLGTPEQTVYSENLDKKIFHKIDLKILCKDVKNYDNLQDWLKSKNAPKYLLKNIIITIINLNPPENVKNQLLSILL